MQITSSNTDTYSLQELVNGKQKEERKVQQSLDGSLDIINAGSQKSFDDGTTNVLGQDDFLNLLMTQLRYQDPMKPQNDTEFIAQLAQFSSLESNKNMEGSIGDLSTDMKNFISTQQSSANASNTSLLGKEAKVEVKDIEFDGSAVPLQLQVDESTGKGYVAIRDAEGKGVLLQEIDASASDDHTVDFVWDGKNSEGQDVESGTYSVEVVRNTAGIRGGYAFEQGAVNGIRYGTGGKTYLDIGAGSYSLDQLVQVEEPKPLSTQG